MSDTPLLSVEGLDAYYGDSHVLFDLSVTVGENEVVGLFGRNGMGKTTLLRSIVNLIDRKTGVVYYKGENVTDWKTHEIIQNGIAYVPEERSIYAGLTGQENLELAAPADLPDDEIAARISRLYDRFPRLEERADNLGGTLSGGEQQMLAIARGLIIEPDLLLLDEPTEGLAPSIMEDVVEIISDIAEQNRSIVLVEQNINRTLSVIDRGYMIENGRIVSEGTADRLGDEELQDRYLSV